MPNEFKVKNGLIVDQGGASITGSSLISGSLAINASGSSVFTVDGTSGRLFSVDDSLSGSLFSVNTVAGLPVMEAFSDNTVRIGQYGKRALFISQSFIGVGKETALNATLDVSGSAVITGSLSVSSGITGSLFGSASYAFTASYALNAGGASIDTGSFATTGSNIFTGNQTVTGSLLTSGSNTLVGNTILTGSLSISGSTIQVGNNTLLGNTLLTGSVTISGSVLATGPLTATSATASFGYVSASFLDITGKQTVKGYTQYLPTSDIVPITVPGGYIYSSGSQGDLYFAQTNGSINNVIRLRWLEGNMYTGLLNGAVISTLSTTTYQVSSGSGIIVSLNGSLSSDPYPTVKYLTWPNLSASIAPLSASYDQSFISIKQSGSTDFGEIFAQGTPYADGEYNTVIAIGNIIHQNRSTINATATYPAVAYGLKQRTNDFIKAFGALKLSGLNTIQSGSTTGSILVTSGTAYSDGRNYTTDVNNPSYVIDSGSPTSKIFRYYQSGSGWVYLTNGGAGYETIDPTQYANNGVLTAVPGTGINREWTIQRVFYFPAGATKGIYVYYGNETYLTELEAIANIPFENFIEAPNTAAGAILSSYLIVRNNADLTDTTSYKIQQGGLFRSIGGSGGGGSPITQTLASLSDVSISGPTNGQPLVYNGTTTKWENQSTLTATLIGNANTATTSSYAATASLAPAYVLNSSTSSMSVLSASYATTAALAPNYVLNSSTSSMLTPYVLSTNTGSFVVNSQTSSMSVLSSSFASTASSAENFTVRGTLTAQTLVVQTITSSTEFITGSTKFGSLLANTHQFTGSVSITGSLLVASNIVNNLTSSYAITASYWSGSTLYALSSSYASTAALAPNYVLTSVTSSMSVATSSYVLNAISSSYAATASLAPAYVLNSSTSSFIVNSQTSSMSVATASYVLNSISSSFSATSSLAPNYVLNSSTASMLAPYVLSTNTASFVTNSQTSSMTVLSASFSSTSSFVNTLNQSVIITGSLVVGSGSLGVGENTLILGPAPAGGTGEGGQILLSAKNDTYTSASMLDNWQNYTRLLRGSNGGSDAVITQWNMHTKQIAFPAYNSVSAFAGSAVANLAVDNNGNILTVSTTGGTVFPYTGNAQINGGLGVTGSISTSTIFLATNTNGAAYLRGGDDAELWDINTVNTLGIYGQQDQTVASIKLGSNGGIISGRSGSVGIGTVLPVSGTLHVNGNIFASSFTGSLFGTSSWSNNSISSSYSATASLAPNYVLNSSTSSFIINSQTSSMTVLSASFASTSSFINTLIQNVTITGSINISGSTVQTGSFTLNNNAGTVTTFAGDPFTFARIGNTLSFFAAAGGVGNNSIIYSNSTLRLGGGSNAAQIVLDSSGNKTGINKASPNAALDVNGNTIITGSLIVTQGITGSHQGTSSWANNSVSSSYSDTASLAPNYVLNSSTSSMLAPYVLSTNTGSFVTNSQTSSMSVLSASFASTASSAENFTVRGTLTAQTIIVQTITSSIDYVTGSTRFGSASTSTHQFTGSVSITGSLAVNGSGVILNNQTSSMSVATASYVLNSVSSSYAATASLAPLYVLNSSTSSFVISSQTASFVTNNQTASFATTGSNRFIGNQTITGSLVLSSSAAVELTIIGNQTNTGSLIVTQGITGSLQGTSSWANNSISASYVTASNVIGNVTSASYAISASYAPNMGSSTITIADEGAVQGTVTFLNFIGSAVTATVSSNTGSITITGGAGGGLLTKAGAVTNTTFTGTPRKATITFSAAFPNTSYGIVVTGADLRSWTIESKVAGSFIINTNSNAALTGDTYWVATAYGETA